MDRRRFLLSSSGLALVSTRNSWPGEASAAGGTVSVGDSLVQIDLTFGRGGLRESRFRVGAQEIPRLAGIPWLISCAGREVASIGSTVRFAGERGKRSASSAAFEGETDDLNWTLKYQVSGPGRITKTLALTPRREILLRQVSLWNASSTEEPLIARTKLQDNAAFYRHRNCGLFVSLDFPFSKILYEKGLTKVTYPPFETLQAGRTYVAHSLTMGAYLLTGKERYGYDVGEVEAIDAYIQGHAKPRFERPMFVTSSIVNRYTQNSGDVVFYTMRDQPTLGFNIDLLKRDLALMSELGIEYYQVFPGVFDWVEGDPAPETVKELVKYGRSHGVRIGDYSGSNYLFCPHFNEYRNSLNRPEWLMQERPERKSQLKPFCFGVPEFIRYYTDTVVTNCKRYGFEVHCLDFLHLAPCYAVEHGHPAGPDGLYHQVRGLVQVLEAINSVSPQMMTWSNSGDWEELLPKIAWVNHNLYLTDPFIRTPWQGLNMTRLLDDARREQMVSLHFSHFLPYRFFSNCQYFFSQNSVVPDIRNFEYGALSTIAVTPNLSVGEIRPWVDKLSAADREHVCAFYSRWTRFLQDNYDLWKKTYVVGDSPGMGSIEIYSHAEGMRGFIFIVNPHYWGRTVELPLGETMGFAATGSCEVRELYPEERLRLTAQGPFVSLGTKLPLYIEPQQVLVLEVRPAPNKIDAPRLYGLPGSVEVSNAGYLVKTQGQQGCVERFAVLLPPSAPRIGSAEVLPDFPKQPKRSWAPTPLKMLAADDQGTLFEMAFRRPAAPTELREWKVLPGELDEGVSGKWNAGLPDSTTLRFPLFIDVREPGLTLPMSDDQADNLGFGPLADFCGAYIDNAFSEIQPTRLELKTGETQLPKGRLVTQEAAPVVKPLSPLAKDERGQWWVQASFGLPFINTIGSEPPFDEHPMLVLPLIRQNRVKAIHAWLNGVALPVERYRYPRNRDLGCYYADLIGSSAVGNTVNVLVIHLQH